MNQFKMNDVLKHFFKDIKDCKISPFGSGLIHRTFFLQHAEGDFILQEMNHQVFKQPELVMQNIQLVGNHLREKKYPKSILTIRPSVDGHLFFKTKNGKYWRCLLYTSPSPRDATLSRMPSSA